MAGVHRTRRSPRAALLAVLAAALAAAAWMGRQTAFLAPSVLQVPLRGRIARAARGGAEPEEDDDDDYEFNPAEVIGDLKPGQEFQGVVTRVLNFGAFVDIGFEKEGLVPISKLSDDRVEDVQDVVKEGQGVTVWVSEYDGDRLTLSMSKNKIFVQRRQQADLSLFEGIGDSEWLPGKVVNVREFGAFVAVAPPGGGDATAQGLVHITQIRDGFVDNVADEVAVGDDVKVRVLRVDLDANKLALSMRGAAAAPTGGGRGVADLSAFQEVPDTVWCSGVVKGLANFGAFVEVQPPEGGSAAQGLVHISQIKDGFIEDPAEELEVDQEVQVRVLNVDTDTGKMALTMRQISGGESGGD